MEDTKLFELKCHRCKQMLGYMYSAHPISSDTGTASKITIDQGADTLIFLCKDCRNFYEELN